VVGTIAAVRERHITRLIAVISQDTRIEVATILLLPRFALRSCGVPALLR